MKHGSFIHQLKYMKDMMKKLNMAELKPVSTPMSTATVLDPNENVKVIDQRDYMKMIDSLLYDMAIRLDILFAMCLCACFQASPHTSHWQAIQWIFKYCWGS
jgi:hypothetical protein